MALCRSGKPIRTCASESWLLVHPINGSGISGAAGSNSSTHTGFRRCPDDMADRAGRKMRAVGTADFATLTVGVDAVRNLAGR